MITCIYLHSHTCTCAYTFYSSGVFQVFRLCLPYCFQGHSPLSQLLYEYSPVWEVEYEDRKAALLSVWEKNIDNRTYRPGSLEPHIYKLDGITIFIILVYAKRKLMCVTFNLYFL